MPLAVGGDADAQASQAVVEQEIRFFPDLCAFNSAFGQFGHDAPEYVVSPSINASKASKIKQFQWVIVLLRKQNKPLEMPRKRPILWTRCVLSVY